VSAKRPVAETIEDLEFLDESGVGAIEAAERLGFATANALYTWLRANDAMDLWHSMHKRDPQGADITARPQVATSAPSRRDAVLTRAAQSDSKRLRAKGERIAAMLDELSAALDSYESANAEREQARKEVERLERQLAEAKAKLRGSTKPAPAAQVRSITKGEFPCRNEGCDRVFDTGQGRSLHERLKCEHRDEAAS
jgi:hypothetical protein